jgi:hypothetical protein
MWPMDIPQFMNIGEFCKHIGMSRWYFMRISDRYRLSLKPRGTAMLVEVEPTIKILATVPDIEWMMSDRGLALVRQVQEASQNAQPQDAA